MPAKYFEMAQARQDGWLNIGEAADASGVSAKMIRHYEEIGLISRAGRTVAGYRIYRLADVHALRFVRRARDLGFSLAEIKALLGLWHDQSRASADVRRLARTHIDDLDARIARMQSMRQALERLVAHCHGDARPDCPILDDLSRGGA